MKAARPALLVLGLLIFSLAFPLRAALAIDNSIPAIHGDLSRSLLGDGTGVVIGILDSGIDSAHPALTGNDSLGNPRLVNRLNFVPSEPGNFGDDVFGHGTWVSSVVLSNDNLYKGLAPDARYVNARVLDSTNQFPGSFAVLDGIGFAVSQGSDILNLSLNFVAPNSNGMNAFDRMLDWAAFSQGINVTVSAGNISSGNGEQQVRSPASLYNGVAVGRTNSTFSGVHFDSSIGPTADGRSKPDVVAPGTFLTMANANWETAPAWDPIARSGTSFAAPHVAGLMAQQIEYGRAHSLSTNPLVIKTTLMNSAVKVPDQGGNAWEPAASSLMSSVLEVTSPLDGASGAGQIDGLRLYEQYSAGEQSPGLVNPIGWDLNTIVGTSALSYTFNAPVQAGSLLDVTLGWFRHIDRTDNGDGIINSADTFSIAAALDNLDLTVLLDGTPIATSMSELDNLEHLHLSLAQTGTITLRVDRIDIPLSGADELFAIAWNVTAVPEPAAVILAVWAAVGIWICRRRMLSQQERIVPRVS